MSYTPPSPPPGPDGPDDRSGNQYGEPPPGQYGGGGYGGPPNGPTGNNTKAVISLVVGIIGLPLAFCCSVIGLVGIVAIILGRSARKEIAASGGAQTGEGMAKAGFILGIVDVAIAVVLIIVSIVLVTTGHGSFNLNTYSG